MRISSTRVPAGAADVEALLKEAGVKSRLIRHGRGGTVFAQGEAANAVFCLRSGGIRLSVTSSSGKEAVIATLAPGDFLGEGCLAGQRVRMARAVAIGPTVLWRIAKDEMARALHDRPDFAERFLAHMLRRNIRIEEDLVDRLFNSAERRLARTLLLLARYGTEDAVQGTMTVSQSTLAEMVGTTRPRVNHFLNKFRNLGLIEYNGGLKINKSLLSVVLHD